MRLLDTTTGQFVERTDLSGLEYAILSHTWDPEGEQSYQDVRRLQQSFLSESREKGEHASDLKLKPELGGATSEEGEGTRLTHKSRWTRHLLPESLKTRSQSLIRRHWLLFKTSQSPSIPEEHVTVEIIPIPDTAEPSPDSFLSSPLLSEKIRQACAIARENGHRLLWIDSCCIDKTSSSELSEAINSMHAWYRGASVCYAFLADVPSDCNPRENPRQSEFWRSRWFRRGWTLQELIAPRLVVFLSHEWRFLGTKSSLASVVEDITSINRRVLTHQMELQDASVAERMSWAASRYTTRVEDEAYSLMGIFDINMPTLYGEGRLAFVRLQEEIMKRIPDQTLFAWGRLHPVLNAFADDKPLRSFRGISSALIARTPWDFWSSRKIRALPHGEFLRRIGLDADLSPPSNAITPYGLHTQLPVIPVKQFFPSVVEESGHERFLILLACENTDAYYKEPHVLALLSYVDTDPGTRISRLNRVEFYTASRAMPSLRRLHSHALPYHLIPVSAARIAACRAHLRVQSMYAHIPSSTLFLYHAVYGPEETSVQPAPWTTRVLRDLGYTLTTEELVVQPEAARDAAPEDDEQDDGEIQGPQRFACLTLFSAALGHDVKLAYPSPHSFDDSEGKLPVWIATGSPLVPMPETRAEAEAAVAEASEISVAPSSHADGGAEASKEGDDDEADVAGQHNFEPVVIEAPEGWGPERAYRAVVDTRKPVEVALPVPSGGSVTVRLSLLPYSSGQTRYMDLEMFPDTEENAESGPEQEDS